MLTEETKTVQDGPQLTAEITKIAQQLKVHYGSELERLVQVWDRLKEPPNAHAADKIFSSQIIQFEDNEGKVKIDIIDFEQILGNRLYKRVVITGQDGHGKSTMVQEIVRQWIKGEAKWTHRFSLVFLVRLKVINRKRTESLENLLESVLSHEESKLVCNYIRSKNKVMFIFDGVDEFRYHFCDEINDMLIGFTSRYSPFVVVTTKPDDRQRNLKGQFSLSIKLNGLKEHMISQHLRNSHGVSLAHLLKIPLFHAIYDVVLQLGGSQVLNFSTLIERYLKLLVRRYRRENSLFSDLQEQELIALLGQAAQAQYSMIDNQVNVEEPILTSKYLDIAKSIGYLHESSKKTKLVFPHQIMAQYFAALYWASRKTVLVHDIPYLQMVEFMEPKHGLCSSLSMFSCMLSHYNKNYRLYLWNQFTEYIPLLNDYNELPSRTLESTVLRFPDISDESTGLIMNKIEFITDNPSTTVLTLYSAKIISTQKFPNLLKFRNICLYRCMLKIPAFQFFLNYNLKSLELDECIFSSSATTTVLSDQQNERRDLSRFKLQLQSLLVQSPEGDVSNFLWYIMEQSKSLQNLHISNIVEIDDHWVLALRRNQVLLKSIQNLTLEFTTPVNVTNLLQAVTSMSNLTELNLKGCYMSKSEIDILAQFFEKGARKLKSLSLEDDENIGNSVHLWESVGHLTALKDLEISECKLIKDCLYELQKIFRYKLINLEKCTFVKENVIRDNSNILMVINSSRTIRQVIFDKCQLLNSELELAKEMLNLFKFESQTVMRDNRMDTVLKFFKS